jgi:hypothetical protein
MNEPESWSQTEEAPREVGQLVADALTLVEELDKMTSKTWSLHVHERHGDHRLDVAMSTLAGQMQRLARQVAELAQRVDV